LSLSANPLKHEAEKYFMTSGTNSSSPPSPRSSAQVVHIEQDTKAGELSVGKRSHSCAIGPRTSSQNALSVVVIPGTFMWVGQHLVGFLDLAELGRGLLNIMRVLVCTITGMFQSAFDTCSSSCQFQKRQVMSNGKGVSTWMPFEGQLHVCFADV